MQNSAPSEPPESQLLRLCRRPIDAAARARACWTLLDWTGCALAARNEPAARAMGRALGFRDPMAQLSHAPSAQDAAFAAGALGNVLEMDDLHRAAILHAGDTICPAALAVGLRRDTTGSALLDAVVRGYEAAIRIGRVAASGGYTPFYNSGTCGVFGAAIAAAELEGLDGTGMADALAQAGMQAAGIWQCRLEPGFSKQLACAHAARAGVLSARLAAAGFAGPRRILTGPLGFFASFYPKADPGTLAAPTERWGIEEVSFKPWPACRHTHPAIAAALDLRGRLDGPPTALELRTYGAAIAFCDAPEPETDDAARFSLQHAVAVTLLRGAPGIADFGAAARADAEVAALRARVTLVTDEARDAAFPAAYGATLIAEDAQGRRIEARCDAAPGDPEAPLSEAEIRTKFDANARHGGVPAALADRLAETLLALPDAPDAGALARALSNATTPERETA
ncbi:MmgE/PrpD family protein [Jannaschia formosa]|uniref:MmgE/PrpD family protein n=1 Tax=Jannaschia formosa TaxID=2259592 RepID=UPI000E1BA5A4|nr:MmgE/PrpD family protein [Jannaschia formosa]TFL16522.1 MmgE/PrpD family protein [Jannaschia formosa]